MIEYPTPMEETTRAIPSIKIDSLAEVIALSGTLPPRTSTRVIPRLMAPITAEVTDIAIPSRGGRSYHGSVTTIGEIAIRSGSSY